MKYLDFIMITTTKIARDALESLQSIYNDQWQFFTEWYSRSNTSPRKTDRFLDLLDTENYWERKKSYKNKQFFMPIVRESEKGIYLRQKTHAYKDMASGLDTRNLSTTTVYAEINGNQFDFSAFTWPSSVLTPLTNTNNVLTIDSDAVVKLNFWFAINLISYIKSYVVAIISDINGIVLSYEHEASGKLVNFNVVWAPWASVSYTFNDISDYAEIMTWYKERTYQATAWENLEMVLSVEPTTWQTWQFALDWDRTYMSIDFLTPKL